MTQQNTSPLVGVYDRDTAELQSITSVAGGVPVAILSVKETARAKTQGRSRQLVATVGSSLTDLCFVNTASYGAARQQDRSWISHARYLMGDKMGRIVTSYSAGGKRIDEILLQIQTAVQQDVDWIIGDLGVINSISFGKSLTTMVADVKSCIDAVADSGKRGLFINATPLSTAASSGLSTLVNHQLMAAVNSAMMDYGRKRGVTIVDAASIIVDSASATGAGQASLLQVGSPVDGLHYAQAGARLIGVAVASAWSAEVRANMTLSTSQARKYDATNAPTILTDNPLFIGTAGTNNASALCPGSVPTGSTLSNGGGGTMTGTSAVGAAGSGIGNEWTLTVTSVSAIGTLGFMTLQPDFSSRVTAGDIVRASAKIDVTGAANLWGVWVYVSATVNGVSTFWGVEEPSTDSSGILIGENSQADITGGVRHVEFTVPSGVITNMRFFANPKFAATASTCVIKASQVTIEKITT